MPRAAAVDPRGLLVRLRFGGAHLPQPSWFADASVQAEEGDPASTLSLYRRALALRHELLAPERLEWVETGRGDVLRFRRPNGWEVVTVFGSAPLGRVAGGGGCRTARDRRRHAGVGEGCRGVSPGIPRCSGGDGASDPIDAFNGSVASTENDKLSR